MGWKNVREHYGIGHIVKIVAGTLHIGSQYVGDLVTVTPDGVATVNRTFSNTAELLRYRDAINSDPGRFRELMANPDTFTASIPVYTWKDGEIVEKACEEFGWPNVTHDGELMYENTFFLDRRDTLKRAIREASAAVEAYERTLQEAREHVVRREALRDEAVRHETSLRMLAMAATPPRRGETTA